MRITADIIDEEVSDDPVCDKAAQTDGETLNTKEQNDSKSACVHANVVAFLNHKTDSSIQHHERITDMCNKFRKLNVSENSSYPTNTVLKMEEYANMVTHLKDKMDDKKNIDSNLKQETPPAWLLPFFAKIKQEIKTEILEEISKLPQMQGQLSSGGKNESHQSYNGDIVHPGIFCDNCDQLIHGIRYKCGNCSDFDLCQECESLPNIHNKNHIFLKIRYPVSFRLYERQKLTSIFVPNPAEIFNTTFRNHPRKMLYEAKFIRDETIPDGTVLPPATAFEKCWKILNTGRRGWTHSTKLQHVEGCAGLIPNKEQVDVPLLRPGEEGVVSVMFTTPCNPGTYKCHWNFSHKSRPFGHTVWCHIVVSETEPAPNPAENAAQVTVLPSSGPSSEKSQEVASIVEVLTAVKEEHKRGNMIPRKLAVNSHTATPNNTPFDLTPPKSPDHHAPVIELKDVAEDKETTDSRESIDENDDDEASVVSLSSSESDAEFVVIPMPKCFNLSESLASHKIPQLAQYFQADSVGDQKDPKPSEPKVNKSETISIKASFTSETVSQETGVPELAEHTETLKETPVNNAEQKIYISHNVSADGSSSEISIIESGENSPTSADLPELGEIRIAVTEDMKPNIDDSPPVVENKEISVQVETSEEPTADIPSSATFPKFPVEGITSIYEPAASTGSHERTVQVLPERLIYAPLNATAAIYNTARNMFSTIQNQRNNAVGTSGNSTLKPMEQLSEMGFCNREQNEELLKKHKNDVTRVVAELVNLNDNDWYASRHVPASPPAFYD